MTLSGYLRVNAGELLLVVLSAWSCAVVAVNGFFLDGLSEQLGYAGRAGLLLALTAVLVLALYAASFNRRQLAGGVILYAALLVALFAVALGCSTGEDLYADAEGNYLYLAVVVAMCATGCFALTRTLAGSAVWFVAAALTCSVVQAFYEADEVVMGAVAALTALALVVHRNFRLGLERAQAAQAPSHVRNFFVSVGAVAVVGAFALTAWFLVIAPSSPSVFDVTLITEYRKPPIEELKGTAQEKPVIDISLTSDILVDGDYYTTDDLIEDPQSSVVVDATSLLEQEIKQEVTDSGVQEGQEAGVGDYDVPDPDNPDPGFENVSYHETFPWLVLLVVLAVLVVLSCVGYFVGRRVWRTKRLERWLALAPRAQVEHIYLFVLSRLRRLGFKVTRGTTLAEFSCITARQMDVLTEETRVPLSVLTAAYEGCAYGAAEPTEDEVVACTAYYLRFWKAARVHLGGFKYFFRSFRL